MISYIGGKYRIGKWIGEFIPKDNIETYVEPFGGAFWVYLRNNINAKNIIYNDFNPFMYNLFVCLKNPEILLRKITNNQEEVNKWNYPPQKRELFDKYLKEILKIEEENYKNLKVPDYEIAIKYVYLLTQVFSGIGLKKNTKMIDLKGKYKSKFEAFVNRLKNQEYINKLKKINAYNMDFKDIIKKMDTDNTLFYVDPPYFGTENYYSFHNFNKKKHKELIELLKKIKGKFILSYYDFPELSDWLPETKYKWYRKEFSKNASAKSGKKQNKSEEIIILNF